MTSCHCSMCHKAGMPILLEGRPSVVIAAGTLDDDPGVRPALHIFTGSKAPWWEIRDELAQFEEFPPGYDSEGRPTR